MADQPPVESADDEPEAPSPTPPEEGRLGRHAVRGAAVTMTGQLFKMAIQILSVVILARLLSPHDYGLLAMVTAVIGVTDIFRDFGLSSAAIQAPTLSREEQSNLFWLNTALGAVLTVLVWLSGPLLAAFYDRPELVPITHAMAFSFLINGMATQYRADLSRRMSFKRLAVADVVGALTGLILAVVLALLGTGYWALVAQQLTQATVMLLLVVIVARWLPRAYDRKVSVRRFLSFGWRLAGSQVVNYIGNNIDTVMLGLRVGASSLGLYNRAWQLIMTPLSQIRGPLNTVAVPVLSKLQNDDDRFQDYVAKGQMAIGYTIVAGLALVAGSAGALVDVLLGPSWQDATDVLRLLAVAGALTTLSYVGYWVYVTKGLVNHLLRYTFISAGIRVVSIVTGSNFGLLGIAAAVAIAPAIAWPLSLWWLSRRASIPIRRLWLGGVRIIVFCGAILAVTFPLDHVLVAQPALLRLVLEVLAAAVTYVVMALAVPVYRRDIGAVITTVRASIGR